ncbi:MAG: trimethylamine methyltransferase family protein [Pseudomonadota bacterium]
MARKPRVRRRQPVANSTTPAPRGGGFRPLSDEQLHEIVAAAVAILERTGLADCPADIAEQACSRGAQMRAGRLHFPVSMVEDAIERAPRSVQLPGYLEQFDLRVGEGHVHIGTGGAAVEVLQPDGQTFSEASLSDLYRLMTLVGRTDAISYGLRPVVARDMPDDRSLDINTAFAALSACPKPIGVSFCQADHVGDVVSLFDVSRPRGGAFEDCPFAFAVIVHAVSPLRYASEGVEIMRAAMAAGMPLQICTAAQAGATSPVTLAGALALGLAETLAGLMIVDCLKPQHPTVFAFMPFVSDLRTGAMSGGGGESAVANAAAAQLLLHLGLPSTVAAGMTDAKTQDVQAGYEKGYSVALAAQAGADMINLSVGMLGSIMAASPEALVIDAEMCAAILRSVRGVETGPGLIDLDVIHSVATGPGHFLGEAQTLARMKSDYVYPDLANRQSIADWQSAGRPMVWEAACDRVADLTREPPAHLPPACEARIRAHFDIKL